MNEMLEEMIADKNAEIAEKNAEIAKLKKELDGVKQALQWTHEKLVDAEIAYRRAADELMRVVETPDPKAIETLLDVLDTKCGFIECDRCQMAAKVIRQYARKENARH